MSEILKCQWFLDKCIAVVRKRTVGLLTTIFFFFRKTKLTLAQVLDEFDNIPEDVPLPSDIYLEPPDWNIETDEDSGDEDGADPNCFNGNQLRAMVELRFSENDIDLTPDDFEIENEVPNVTSSRISQIWEPGNEDSLPLASLMYHHKEWSGTKVHPLTLSSKSSALEFFQLFFPSEFVEAIVQHTKSYAASKNRHINIDVEDMYAFIGVMIVSGYNPLPRRRLYWSNDDDTNNALISKWMRRKMFEDIFTNIHFCDNNTINQSKDRFIKVRPLISHLNHVFLKYAPLELNISVDESMIPYFGKHPCKQFIRNKPVRFGYKAWVAASNWGYCYQFDIYQGRSQERDPSVGLGESVVVSFAKKINDRFPRISFSYYFDNFFTGPNLIYALTQNASYGTGTVRENRIKNKKMSVKKIINKQRRGYYENYVDKKNQIIHTRWKDNKIVSLLSNVYGEHPICAARRYERAVRTKIDIPQPYVVKMYNRNMGGVDLLDRHISNYRMGIRGKKLYMPAVLWMLDLAVSNSWSLAKSYNYKKDQLAFRRELAKLLLIRYGTLRSQGKTVKKPEFLSKGPHISATSNSRLRCKLCHSHTVYRCTTCNVALHTKCSEVYHSQLK